MFCGGGKVLGGAGFLGRSRVLLGHVKFNISPLTAAPLS